MKKTITNWLVLGMIGFSQMLLAQGNSANNGSGGNGHQVCLPVSITGDKNATSGTLQTYEHNYTAHAGESFIWSFEGAREVDGVPF